jgi:hypothetical protein
MWASLRVLAVSMAITTAGSVEARDNVGVLPLLMAPSTLKADTAYLLVRTSTAKSGMFPISHVLLRIPTAAEIADYRAAKRLGYDAALPELTRKAKGGNVPSINDYAFDYEGRANAFVVESGKFIEDGMMRTLLLEVPPGDYVVYGSTLGKGGLVSCNCLGTVRFAVNAGVITDIGSLYVDKVHKPSPIPHLEDNLGRSMFQYGFVFGQALVPPETVTPVPAALRGLKIEAARFEVVGQYYEPGALSINRLAPIPGLLGYVHGKPVDLRTGKAAD